MSGFHPVRATAQFVLGSTIQKVRPNNMHYFTGIARGTREFVTHNSSAILTGVAIAGTVTTAILAVRATKPALIDIQQAESERTEPLKKTEVVKLCWKHYIPAAGVGVVTIACIVGAQSVNTRKHAALISAYTLSEKSFSELQDKVEETFGKNKAEKVREDISQDVVNANPSSQGPVIVVNGGDHMFMEKKTGRHFKSTVDKVKKAENMLNFELNNNAYASLNDLYRFLEIDTTELGEELGWNSNQVLELELSTVLDGDVPVIVIWYSEQPMPNYYKVWG